MARRWFDLRAPAYDFRAHYRAGHQYNVHGTFGSSNVSTSKVS